MTAILLTLLLAGAADGPAKIQIEKSEPRVERKMFDPQHLPDPAPPLEPGEAAVCVYNFTVDTSVTFKSTIPPKAAKAEVKIESVTVKLGLQVTIWLPNGAAESLKAHEEAHRVIAEAFYKNAQEYARPLAEKLQGRTFAVPGKTWEKSANEAVDPMMKKLNDDYLAAINGPAGKAETQLDDLTDHARNKSPTAEEATRKVLEDARR